MKKVLIYSLAVFMVAQLLIFVLALANHPGPAAGNRWVDSVLLASSFGFSPYPIDALSGAEAMAVMVLSGVSFVAFVLLLLCLLLLIILRAFSQCFTDADHPPSGP